MIIYFSLDPNVRSLLFLCFIAIVLGENTQPCVNSIYISASTWSHSLPTIRLCHEIVSKIFVLWQVNYGTNSFRLSAMVIVHRDSIVLFCCSGAQNSWKKSSRSSQGHKEAKALKLLACSNACLSDLRIYVYSLLRTADRRNFWLPGWAPTTIFRSKEDELFNSFLTEREILRDEKSSFRSHRRWPLASTSFSIHLLKLVLF